MGLDDEIAKARKEIVSDGYDMSFGEVMNLYKEEELIINPEFQRLFRWNSTQKTRFIESLLLGIPIPPIFVFQEATGIWELIDGLQRLSTVLEFSGMLLRSDGTTSPVSTLEGTQFLPSLAGKTWEPGGVSKKTGIGKAQQLQIKRARIRVEILQKESDPQAKYELFQRLNTGGSQLSEQEVRNCIAVMLNKEFHNWLRGLASNKDFRTVIAHTREAIGRQADMELVLRFLAFRNVPYRPGLDVHEYLDQAVVQLASDDEFPMGREGEVFVKTFAILNATLGSKSFKRWDGTTFKGKFLMSVFEVIATGVSLNLKRIEQMTNGKRAQYIERKARDLWSNEIFVKNSGAGVRGTTRLANLLPLAKKYFRP